MKILALCDSPTVPTGFGRVAREILSRFARHGAEVEVWAINYNGFGYRKAPWATLYPAGASDWTSEKNLRLFLKQLANGGYTHCWVMQDSFLLALADFAVEFQRVCKARNIRTMYYFPVDSDWEPEWAKMVDAVDVPVAYTQYGRRVALRALSEWRTKQQLAAQMGKMIDGEVPSVSSAPLPDIAVLPHGIEDIFEPLPEDKRRARRLDFWDPAWCSPDDFLLVNINQHQRRKDIARSLEILAALRRLNVPAKLLLHMHETSPYDYTSINLIARQLGLISGEHYFTHDAYFRGGIGMFGDDTIRDLHNIADAYLTTTTGEGWGLGITEALACGCPVFIPDHTSCGEIARRMMMYCGMERRFELLPVGERVVLPLDNSRLRPRVDVEKSAEAIARYWQSGEHRRRPALPAEARQWMSWDNTAKAMWNLLKFK